jgi:protein-tyrosine phosphatase
MEWVIEGQLARGARPGYGKDALGRRTVERDAVPRWFDELERQGIRSIICLMNEAELHLYDWLPNGLIGHARQRGLQVQHIAMSDSQPPQPEQLQRAWSAFQALPAPVLVHCSGGQGRTGLVVDHIRHQLALKS